MSNVNSPFGLRPTGRSMLSTSYSGQVRRCLISSSDGTAMGIGDPVKLYGDADTSGFTPSVGLASAGATYGIYGVIVALEPNPDALYTVYRTASTARYCYVCTDPFMEYEVQAGATILPYTTVGLNAVLKAGSVNTYTGMSGWYMDSGDSTAPSANTTYQLLVLGLANRPNNDIASAYAVWRVMISLHTLNTGGTNTAGTALIGPLGA